MFLCDGGYLFPTLVAAAQARAQTPADVEIRIFLDGVDLDEACIATIAKLSGARAEPIPGKVIDQIEHSVPPGFFQTHVNRSALFRLFIADLVSPAFDQILYVDGDIQVRHSLAPLLATDLPEGKVGAVPDWKALHCRQGMPWSEATRSYLSGLGLGADDWHLYFNSGVMLASRQTWRAIGSPALEFLAEHPDKCLFHDQSALNHVCRGRVEPISNRWNFLRQYMALPAYREIDPAILHFVGGIKPWDGVFAPWGSAEFRPYVAMARSAVAAGLALEWRRKPLLQRLARQLKPYFRPYEYADPLYRQTVDRLVREAARPVRMRPAA